MIQYDFGRWGVRFVFSAAGSVFPTAMVFALPCSLVSVIVWFVFNVWFEGSKPDIEETKFLFSNYCFVLGFLLVFRTQIAYSRFWEGGSILQDMRSSWLNVTSSLLAFKTDDPAKKQMVDSFAHLLIRLMSMMHCSALQEVADMADENFDILSCEGVDENSMYYLMSLDSAERVEVIMQWIQRLIVTNQANGVISSAPPIVSRCFQELANGRLSFNAAKKIAAFPFPFPYAQMLMVMLIIHWLVAPVMAGLLLSDYVTCAVATFVTSLAFWCINYIAAELEMPFGDNPNDLPVEEQQASFNVSLRKLMTPAVQALPHFNFQKELHIKCEETKMKCVEEAFQRNTDDQALAIQRLQEKSTMGKRKSQSLSQRSRDAARQPNAASAGAGQPSAALLGSGEARGAAPRSTEPGVVSTSSVGGRGAEPEEEDPPVQEVKLGAAIPPPADDNFPVVPVSPEEAQALRIDQEILFLRSGVEERLSKIVQELVHLLVPSSGALPHSAARPASFAVGDPMHASMSPEFFFNEECE